MVRGFHFTACVLLCLALSACSLKCRYCLQETPEAGCDHKVNVCFPRRDQHCISITLYEGKKMRYRLEGCTKGHRDCTMTMGAPRGTHVKVECCKQDMCNHWETDTS